MEYARNAKQLLSVCKRLENWFSGERLYETVEAESDDSNLLFRWNYRTGKFEYMDEQGDIWKKVVQPHNPVIMAKFIAVMPTLHRAAQEKKESISCVLCCAVEAGEEYLSKLSGFIDDNLSEQETSDDE